jgi:DNA polymerase III alpha subunit
MLNWNEIIDIANKKVSEYSSEYGERLKFEIKEIDKQGANAKWINYYNDGNKFDKNPNGLLLPFLLGMVEEDPIKNRKEPVLNTVRASVVKQFKIDNGFVPSDIIKDSDMPDIDLDCLPEARDPIKEYAAAKYGIDKQDRYGPVCSVGTWQTFKFKNAIIDACSGTGLVDRNEAYGLTTELPDEVDQLKDGGKASCKGRIIKDGEDVECGHSHAEALCPECGSADTDGPTIGKLLEEHENLARFKELYPDVVDYAVQLVGRVRNMGMHAGALIIADRSLYGNIPMAKSGKGHWVSMWTEGRNTQLSKFGYNKWDILGLKTLKYVFECCKLIESNRGISFGKNMEGWDAIDPNNGIAGWYIDGNGKKCDILLNDPHVLKLANEQKTDGIFQFDTDLAKSILANGVRNFEDLMLFNAMGHPGPMASIPEAVANRDDQVGSWRKKLHPDILDVLKDTYGVIVYQEQLQAIWQRVAGFTAPEAQEARKAVAKKWTHKLKPIQNKWIEGASRSLGEAAAEEWWTKMETFGRYAFNRSHAVSYCLVAHRCLWLKAHFAPEFWAAVMSDCHKDKLVRYMGTARSEKWQPTDITYSGTYKPATKADGVIFDAINLEDRKRNFSVSGDTVNQGLIGINGFGESAAEKYEGTGQYDDVDDFIEKTGGKDKSALERFIKLGCFKHMPNHSNSKSLWTWYQYKYCSGKDITKLRQQVREQLLEKDGWNEKTIEQERKRLIAEYKKQYPNRRKIPAKFANWKPKPDDTRDKVMALVEDDFELSDILSFEEEYLGYYLHSPLDLYVCKGDCNIETAREFGKYEPTRLEGVISKVDFAVTKTGKDFAKIFISDGIQETLVMMWQNEMRRQNASTLQSGVGVQLYVEYDETRNIFCVARNETILKLIKR